MIKKNTNVTFRIQESTLQKAREKAMKERQSLNKLVNQWLKNYTGASDDAFDLKAYVEQYKNLTIGRKFTREEMNER